jgi:hypothetical protein
VKVTLKGGPFDGAEVTIGSTGPLLIEGTDVPEGMVARYKSTRGDGSVYRFSEYDRIAVRIPMPGSAA